MVHFAGQTLDVAEIETTSTVERALEEESRGSTLQSSVHQAQRRYRVHVTLSVETYTDSIKKHSVALATIAPAVLDVPVEHCPGWTVSDVLQHLIEVQWFWATIVEQRRNTRVEDGRPVSVERSKLVERFLIGADHLVQVLGDADQSDHVWTWSPLQNDVAFVTRHQVQEIMVHHWDVAHAAGTTLKLATDVATDAIAEFLTLSVSSDADPLDPPGEPFAGRLGLWSTDANEGWTLQDASSPGTVRFNSGLDTGVPTLSGSSSDLLLWLYSRLDVVGDSEAQELGRRLHALSPTA